MRGNIRPLRTAVNPDLPPLTRDPATFRTEARAFLEANAKPRDDAGPWVLHHHTDVEEARAHFESGRAWQRTLYEAGFAGLTYPAEYGGRGGDAWHDRVFAEEAARFALPAAYVSSTIAMLAPALLAHGTGDQRRRLLPRLLGATDAWCQLFSEPGAGSDLASLGCRAVRDGDELVVNGQKVWSSSAQFCERGMLLVRTDPNAPKHRGISFLLADMAAPGVDVRPLVQPTGAAHFNEVFLHDVRIPLTEVLGEIDEGWAPARTVMANEAAFIGGGGHGAHHQLVLLAQEHDLIGQPAIRQELARNYTRERLLELMGRRIVAALREGATPPIDPSILKLYVAQNRVESGNLAFAIAGPAALAAAAGDEQARWAQAELLNRFAVSIGGGTDEVQRNNLAERALSLPREPRPDRDTPWRDLLRS